MMKTERGGNNKMDRTKFTINAERKKCREAADAFGELFGKGDTAVLDAGG